MIDRFARFPRDLARRARSQRLGNTPVLLAHPDWQTPAPTVLWMHGRTATKELDPGRYLRWLRAGIAACAIDLPGHGERAQPGWDSPARTLDVMESMLPEIDAIVEHLSDPALGGLFDLDRLALGGMSLGGMITLRRLCDPHPFVCAAVESTTGWLEGLYFPDRWDISGMVPRWPTDHDPARVRALDAQAQMGRFKPIPLLALHSRADEVVHFEVQRKFVERLGEQYRQRGAPASLIQLRSWERTHAPQEHSGFGRVSHEAKTAQVEFFTRHLRPAPPLTPPDAEAGESGTLAAQ